MDASTSFERWPAAVASPDAGVVTVWSDIGCPWATLALHTLRTAAHTEGLELRIDHRAFPLEWFNRRPTPKPVIDAEVVAIAGLRPELGWRPWAAPESGYPVTTVPAMAAVQAAKHESVGGLPASDQLDAALRHAWYAESRCISIETGILDIAEACPLVDADALAKHLATGAGHAVVHDQWPVARTAAVQGSPHLFTAEFSVHNPGVDYHWTAAPGQGFPRLTSYDDSWTGRVLDTLRA